MQTPLYVYIIAIRGIAIRQVLLYYQLADFTPPTFWVPEPKNRNKPKYPSPLRSCYGHATHEIAISISHCWSCNKQ